MLQGFIEAQEAHGQRVLTGQNSYLPTKGLLQGIHGRESMREVWEALGVKIGEAKPNDPIWTEVELPDGWGLKPTDHSMHSDLVDHKGRPRAGIFYKAAFYNRSAHIFPPSKRYQSRCGSTDEYVDSCHRPWPEGVDYPERWDKTREHDDFAMVQNAVDTATGEVLFTTGLLWISELSGDYQGGEKLASAWLDENFPQWRGHTAYWD